MSKEEKGALEIAKTPCMLLGEKQFFGIPRTPAEVFFFP
jgi:hypothetical protein